MESAHYSAQVVETSVANNSASQDSNHLDDLFQRRKEEQKSTQRRRIFFVGVLYFGRPNQPSSGTMRILHWYVICNIKITKKEENNITIREVSTDADSTPAPDELINF